MQRAIASTALLLGLALVAAAADPPRSESPLQLGFLFEQYFGADAETVEARMAWISESDLAVALHLERHSRLALDEIIGARRAGMSWDAITRQGGRSSNFYYVELPAKIELRGPYTRPYAAWRAEPGADLRLSDDEVRELVLLRALRDYCRLPAGDIVSLRTSGQSPRAIAAAHAPRQLQSTVQPGPVPQKP